jgi:hypothetical protein
MNAPLPAIILQALAPFAPKPTACHECGKPLPEFISGPTDWTRSGVCSARCWADWNCEPMTDFYEERAIREDEENAE